MVNLSRVFISSSDSQSDTISYADDYLVRRKLAVKLKICNFSSDEIVFEKCYHFFQTIPFSLSNNIMFISNIISYLECVTSRFPYHFFSDLYFFYYLLQNCCIFFRCGATLRKCFLTGFRRDKLWICMEYCGGGSMQDIYHS